MTECDVRECELDAPQVEAQFGGHHRGGHHASMSVMSPQMMRRELRKWWLRTPLDQFRAIGNRFKKAGIAVYASALRMRSRFLCEATSRSDVPLTPPRDSRRVCDFRYPL